MQASRTTQVIACVLLMGAVYAPRSAPQKFNGAVMEAHDGQCRAWTAGMETLFLVPDGAVVTRDGRAVSLYALQPYDQVTVFAKFHEDTWVASEIVAESQRNPSWTQWLGFVPSTRELDQRIAAIAHQTAPAW
jgi:hypothetical protein